MLKRWAQAEEDPTAALSAIRLLLSRPMASAMREWSDVSSQSFIWPVLNRQQWFSRHSDAMHDDATGFDMACAVQIDT